MRRIVAGCALLFVASAAMAESWVAVDGKAGDDTFTEVDTTSVAREGPLLKAWVRKTHASEVVVQDRPRIAFMREMSLELVDCPSRMMAPKVLLTYATTAGGPPGHRVDDALAQVHLRDVMPGSVGERELNFICKFRDKL